MKKIRYVLLAMLAFGQVSFGDVPLAPEAYRKPENFAKTKHAESLAELSKKHSAKLEAMAKSAMKKMDWANKNGKYKPSVESLAGHRAPEWFLDAKFGLFIDWGVYSVAGYAPKLENGAMYPDWYLGRMYGDPKFREYHAKNWGSDFFRDDFIQLFTAEKFDASQFAELAKKVGAKYVVPFGKHHCGYALWKSSYTKRNSVDMTPHRNLASEIASACRSKGLKFGMYFSIDEWEYPILKDDGSLGLYRWAFNDGGKLVGLENEISGKIAVKDFIGGYILPQAQEMIEMLSPDILWLDGEWDAPASSYRSFELAAYYYNINDGKKEVAVNDRYGVRPEGGTYRAVLGDFFTSEYGENQHKFSMENYHPWEACRGISQSFGFNWQDDGSNTVSSADLVWMLSDIVARGGNLLLLVNLDGKGALPQVQKDRLCALGGWLEKNGDAIYATRPLPPYVQDGMAFTQSKDLKRKFVVLKDAKNAESALEKLSLQYKSAKSLKSGKKSHLSDMATMQKLLAENDGLPVALELFN